MEAGQPKETFRIFDFVLFFAFFFMSVAVGGFFAFHDRKKQSSENYYFGGRTISPIPVGISIAVSYVSAITVIGTPAEIYLYGSVFVWHYVALMVMNIIGITYYVPLYHKLHLRSVFEYLELRFHRSVRLMVSGLGVLSMIVYLAIATFLPALALNTVTPLSLSWTIALTSLTCTIYTALGGMKAVIWTDVFQSIVMMSGMIALLARTSFFIGGVGSIFEATERGGRNNFFKFDIDPRIRSTVWTIGVGTPIVSSYQILCNQIFVQRWLSCKTVNKARAAVGVSLLPLTILNIVSALNGLAAYAYYEGCDPVKSGLISKPDQLIPLLAIDVFHAIPGMAGLFVSAAFCGTLSTVSSGINALAAMIVTDFIPICSSGLSEKKSVMLSKVLTCLFGLTTMIAAYLISLSSSNAIGIATAAFGWFAGPVVSLFTLAAFTPWINYKAALIGCLTSLAFVSWISIGSMTLPALPESWKPLPQSTENCTVLNEEVFNVTSEPQSFTLTTDGIEHDENTGLGASLYAVSPFSYGTFSLLLSIIVAHLASVCTGFRKPVGKERKLSIPIIRTKYLPQIIGRYFEDGSTDYEYDSPGQKSNNDDENKLHDDAI